MALNNLGNDDYHIYEVNDNNISTISPDASSSGCDAETVRTRFACKAGVRKNYDEDSDTAPTFNGTTGFQENVGQNLTVQMIGKEGSTVPMKIGNAFVGADPKWDTEYRRVGSPNARESVTYWIKKGFEAVEDLDNNHAGKIADRYLQIATDNQTKINTAGKAKLLEKENNGAFLFKCKDFAMHVFRMYYGIDKIQPTPYFLTSEFWLEPLVITTKSGNGRFNITVNSNGKSEKICCKAAIFINRKKDSKAGVDGSFKLRIIQLITNADFEAIQAKFAANIAGTEASYTQWVNSVAPYILNRTAPPPSVLTHNGEDTFMAKIGFSSAIPGVVGFAASFSWGSEGTKSGRTSVKMTSFDIGINGQNLAKETLGTIAAKLGEARAKAIAFETAQRNAAAQYANTTKAAVVSGGPATSTTNTTIDIDNPVVTILPNRDSISTPSNGVSGGTTVNNQFSPTQD